jgi:hypothetical protein
MIERYGAVSARNRRTFDTYDRIDDQTYMTVHDMLKFSKLGYSRVTDNLCREIRFQRISKADARVVERYCQAETPEDDIAKFCEWLGISVVGFHWLGKQVDSSAERRLLAPTLNDSQQAFVASFRASGAPVGEGAYIVYGKGLDV